MCLKSLRNRLQELKIKNLREKQKKNFKENHFKSFNLWQKKHPQQDKK